MTFSAGAEDSPCEPGQLSCICADNGECEGGLTCVASRCVDLSGLVTQGEPKGSSEPAPEGAQEAGETPEDGPQKDSASTSASAGGETGAQNSDSGSELDPGEPSSTPKDSSGGPDSPSCQDGIQNNKETDVDCGGGLCPPCALNRVCAANEDCSSGICSQERCVECVVPEDCGPQSDCSQAICDKGRCMWLDIDSDGKSCDDGDPCTVNDRCDGPDCVGQDTRVLVDSFDEGLKNWVRVHGARVDLSMWEVGEAKASSCGGKFGEDPAQDHTQNGKNGVAGVGIGECPDRGGDGLWDCLWTKEMDVSFFTTLPVFSFWRHLHTPARGDLRRGSINQLVYRIDGVTGPKVLKRGFKMDVNDSKWEPFRYKIPKKAKTLEIGFCYKKSDGGSPTFAGWSLDDFKVRQEGCEMDD